MNASLLLVVLQNERFLSSCFEFLFSKIHSHKWNSRKIDGIKLEHTYFKSDFFPNDYIPVNTFLSIRLPGCC